MCVFIHWEIGPKGTYQWCHLEAAEGHSTRAGWRAHSPLWWTGRHICHRLISVKETTKRHRKGSQERRRQKHRKGRGKERRLGDNRHFSDFKCKLKWGFKWSWLQKGEYHQWLKRTYSYWTVPLRVFRELSNQDVFWLFSANDVVVELLIDVGGGLSAFTGTEMGYVSTWWRVLV